MHALVSCLRRARSASRSKPNPKAVPGRERSAEAVDESETGSANFFGPASARDFVFLEPGQRARSARALLENEKPQFARTAVPTLLTASGSALVSPLHRARSASRTKPVPE